MAVLTVTVPDGAVSRIRDAVGIIKGSTGQATVAQVQDLCRDYLRALCLQVERNQRESAVPAATELAVAGDFPST